MIEFESWLSALGARAVVRVSLDGVTWEPLRMIEASHGWMPVLFDLEAYRGEAVLIQFMFAGAPSGRWDDGHDFWRIRSRRR